MDGVVNDFTGGQASMRLLPTRLTEGTALALSLAALGIAGLAERPQAQGQAAVGPTRAINQTDDPLLRSFRFRSIGPASMGGRIDDIAVSETDPNIIYVGYAVGGVFKSENNGVSFEPVFETYGTASIGDIAIHPRDPNIVYVGTGEAKNPDTVYVASPGHLFGSNKERGVYKTTDGGRTWALVKYIDPDTGFTDI